MFGKLVLKLENKKKASKSRLICNRCRNWFHKLWLHNKKTKRDALNIFNNIESFLIHLNETPTSLKLLLFFIINFLFMFVEFLYGYWSNSLGLISDACHMLFDNFALFIGLMAQFYESKHSKFFNDNITKLRYSYGMKRIKVLSGFVNGILLIYVGLHVFMDALVRLFDPPHIHSDKLVFISFLGFIVNLIGLFFFHDAHMLSHGHGNHSHSKECNHGHHHHHSHSHHHKHEHKEHDHNIHGVFLHILADTLGSVGVIISSLMINFFGWVIFDSICSIAIGILIFITVWPLIKETYPILLARTPENILNSLQTYQLSHILANVNGIIGYRLPHFWLNDDSTIIGSINIQINESITDIQQQQILTQVNNIICNQYNIKKNNLCIQLEKQYYLDKIDPIHHSVYNTIIPVNKNKNHFLHKHTHHHNSNNTINNQHNHKKHDHNHHNHSNHSHSNHEHHSHSHSHQHHDHQQTTDDSAIITMNTDDHH